MILVIVINFMVKFDILFPIKTKFAKVVLLIFFISKYHR